MALYQAHIHVAVAFNSHDMDVIPVLSLTTKFPAGGVFT